MTNKVAFNPQDKFLITIGNTFMVTTQNGDTFGLDLAGSQIGEALSFWCQGGFQPARPVRRHHGQYTDRHDTER